MLRLSAHPQRWLFTSLALTALLGCKSPATAIVVQFATDTPNSRPVEVSVRIGVNETSGWSTRLWQRQVPGSLDPALLDGLNSFTISPKPSDPRNSSVVVVFDVTVHPGTNMEARVQFRRRMHMTFTPNRTQTVRVVLPLRCGERAINCPPAEPNCTIARLCELQGLTCGDDATCVQTEIVTNVFDFDGGMSDPDAVARSDANHLSDTSDSAIGPDACTRNCNDRQCGSDGCMGNCGICPDRTNAGATCDVAGVCNYACAQGFADCDVNINNGCETSLISNENCGACGTRCSGATPNCDPMTRMCSGGCGAGQLRCGMSCVAAATDVSNCGSCGTVCSFANATAQCTAGACRMGACAAGYANCDGNDANGCETSLGTGQHCARCNDACGGATPFCDARAMMCASGCSAGLMRCGASCVDTTVDPNNCGACGTACPPRANGSNTCVASMCRTACNAGFGDCNGLAADGCETSLSSVNSCGRCGNGCTLAHATPACLAGNCAIGGCDSGWGNCDGNAANGCETPLNTPGNCGSCGSACARANATPTCAGGSCVIGSCNAGSGNCDAADANGCETPLNTLSNCGGCAVGCSRANATASCNAGACTLGACNAGFGNCDGNAANGCETPLNSLANCGSCGATCARANANVACAAGSCQIASCVANFADCDGNPANGCETSLLANGNCGGCGTSCTLPQQCLGGFCGCAGITGCSGLNRFCCEQDENTCSCTICISMGQSCP